MSKLELIELLTKLLGTLPSMVLNQIDKYVKEGLSYKDIARAVYYMFDIQKRDKATVAKYGIGLVPLISEEANKYYDTIKKQQEQQKKQVIAAEDIETRVVKPQVQKKRKRGIDINEL